MKIECNPYPCQRTYFQFGSGRIEVTLIDVPNLEEFIENKEVLKPLLSVAVSHLYFKNVERAHQNSALCTLENEIQKKKNDGLSRIY